MSHLTPDSWRRMSRHPEDLDPATGRHLEDACSQCDAVAAEDLPESSLDMAVDYVLSAAGGAERLEDRRRLVQLEHALLDRLARSGPPARRWALLVVPAAAALLLFVAFARSTSSSRFKGEAGPAGPKLLALVSNSSGTLAKVDPDQVYPPETDLYFTFDLNVGGYVHLARAGESGPVELVYPPPGEPPERRDPGLHPLAVDGVVNAYSLDGLKGAHRFVLVVSPDRPLDEATLADALAKPTYPSATLDITVGEE